jgi:hypothetical protein
MNQEKRHSYRVGETRPSQLMHTYGVGAIIDLPRLSVIVTGLEDWPTTPQYARPIVEDRLLMAVRYKLPEVNKLLAPPVVPDTGMPPDPFDSISRIGVPVATFPRWMVCPMCRRLASIKTGLFKLKEHPFHPDRTAYRHENCEKGRSPEVVPARFLVTCEKGHLDDFPWIDFVHQGEPCDSPLLRLIEYGASGEARDLEVRCERCNATRRLSDAFGRENREKMPFCRGRRPHLRDYDPDGCGRRMRTLVLGASNTWFPVVYSTVAIPVESGRLAQLVDENWADLQNVTAPVIIGYKRNSGQLGELSEYGDDDIWQAIETRRQQDAGEIPPPSEQPDLKVPEWQVFTQFDPQFNAEDFQLRPVAVPERYTTLIDQVILVEKLREVRAIVGFTRLDAVGELTDPDLSIQIDPAPLSRRPPVWAPAAEVRGEGIFIQFNEAKILEWLARPVVRQRWDDFFESHKKWRTARRIEQAEVGFPGMRYVLIHSFAHALMRQLALECGYAIASIRERIYSRSSEKEGGPMAGLLIYTSAPDSEGTLGGLVSLGEPETLGRHIGQALETAHLCASDPLCAEHPPSRTGRTLHAAACHACLFAPETSCERGNKYLDRSTLVNTVEHDDLAFFE